MNLPKTASEIEYYVLAFLSVDENGTDLVQHGFAPSYASIYHICKDEKLSDITKALDRAFKRIHSTSKVRLLLLKAIFSYYDKVSNKRSQAANPFQKWKLDDVYDDYEMCHYDSPSAFGNPCR